MTKNKKKITKNPHKSCQSKFPLICKYKGNGHKGMAFADTSRLFYQEAEESGIFLVHLWR